MAASILDFYFKEMPDIMLDKKIQQWLVNEENEEEKDEALRQIWEKQVKYIDKPDSYSYASFKKLRSRLNFPEYPMQRIYLWPRQALRIVASLILFCALSALFSLRNEPLSEQLSTAAVTVSTILTAENESCRYIVLPDGSEIWLRRNGTITFPNEFSTGRIVHLEGEAYFSVKKQHEQPFTVLGNELIVKVLGTEFYVKTGEGIAQEVILAEGTVEVTMAGEKLVMKPGDNLLYDSRINEILMRQVELSEVAPWKENNLIFNNTPMKEVLSRISDNFNVTFIIDERLLFEQTFTAAIDPGESLEDVLHIIWNTLRNFNYEIRENQIILTKLQ